MFFKACTTLLGIKKSYRKCLNLYFYVFDIYYYCNMAVHFNFHIPLHEPFENKGFIKKSRRNKKQ